MKKTFIIFSLLFFLRSANSQTYTIDTVISDLIKPIAFDFLPNGNVIVTQKTGLVKIYNQNNQELSTFWNFSDSCISANECGTLGICLDPNYVTNNYIYIFYIHATPRQSRVVRLTNNSNIGSNPFIVFNPSRDTTLQCIHAGGNIKFGRDGKLYISLGDNANSSNSQMLNNPHGKILRINNDGTIPTDNPFYDDGNPNIGNDDRIWAYGLRNSFDFCFSPVNDSIYASENGANLFDEVNFIRKGKNYGWPVCEGYCSPYNPLYKQPMHVWGPPFPAPTGIMVYSGTQLNEFDKKLLMGSASQGLFICTLGNAPYLDTVINVTPFVFFSNVLTGMKQGTDGYIYLLNYLYTAPGFLFRLRHSTVGINNNNSHLYYSLSQNYPNPFNPTTTIKYSILKASKVQLKIYNTLGLEVATLVNENKQSGDYEVEWDASSFPSGVYFYRFISGDFSTAKKMVLIK